MAKYLPPEELTKRIDVVKAALDKHLTNRAFEEIFNSLLHYTYTRIRRWRIKQSDVMWQNIRYYMWCGMKKYDKERAKPLTYLTRWIDAGITVTMRDSNRHKTLISGLKASGFKLEKIADKSHRCPSSDNKLALAKIFSKLRQADCEILIDYYLKERSRSEMKEKLGMKSGQGVLNRRNLALARARKVVGSDVQI